MAHQLLDHLEGDLMSLYKDFIAWDKWANHQLGGYHNQTISRNVGSKLGRATGVGTDTGTDVFHGVLVVGGVVASLKLAEILMAPRR